MAQHIHNPRENIFSCRLRELIENHEELSISELGRRIGHKTGTSICSLLSKSKSGRDDLRLSTFIKIIEAISTSYKGQLSESDTVLYLLGYADIDLSKRIQITRTGISNIPSINIEVKL